MITRRTDQLPWRSLFFGLAFVLSQMSWARAADMPQIFDFCGEVGPRRFIRVVMDPASKEPWNIILSTNGRAEPAKYSRYIFGGSEPRNGFLMAILPMAKTPPLLIFDDGHAEWAGRYYIKCPQS
jgi:hypothetical protein